MSGGSCRQLTIDVPEDLKDAVIGELSEYGAAGIWESGEPFPGIARLEVYYNSPLSSPVDLKDLESRVQSVFLRANLPPPQITVETVTDRDWLGEWKKSYVSFPIGRRFFIIPSWSEAPCPADRMPIRIDPGQAFGTGTHETTQLTLEILEDHAAGLDFRGPVLDLGTGSGILAIAARLLGCANIIGCDIDPDSIRVAVENIDRNVRDQRSECKPDRAQPSNHLLPVFCGSIDAIVSGSVQLLLCNLTADVIVLLFEEVNRTVRPGGSAILSGILVEQRSQIYEVAVRTGWAIEDDRTRGEWIALTIRKPAQVHGA